MRMTWSLLGALVVVVSVAFAGCRRAVEPPPAEPAGYFAPHFQDESQFVIESVGLDLVEMAAFFKEGARAKLEAVSVRATDGGEGNDGNLRYSVQVAAGGKSPPFEVEIILTQPIWSPDNYLALATRLLGPGPKANAAPAADSALLNSLTDLRAMTIEAENLKLSAELAADFGNPLLHEKAALLVGAFALREHSGIYREWRPQLCRMTAHLAMARALSGQATYGGNGQVAEAILLALMNNQTTALERLKRFPSGPEYQPWARAVHAWITTDYRELAKVRNQSLLESVMHFRAQTISVSGSTAREGSRAAWFRQTADFARIANGGSYSVGFGHELRELSLPLEMAELRDVYRASCGKSLDRKQLAAALNETPERCVSRRGGNTDVRIIGWGQWAAFFQRHLCHTLEHNFDFLLHKWGVPDEAKEFSTDAESSYGALRFFPFVRYSMATNEAAYRKAVDDAIPVMAAVPHLVAPDLWNRTFNRPYFVKGDRYAPIPNPHVNEWHRHNPPPGTAYTPKARLYHPSLTDRPDFAARLQSLRALAPYDRDLAEGAIRLHFGKAATFEQLEEVYRPLLAFSAPELLRVAGKLTNDPVRYEQHLRQYAEIQPAGNYVLGHYFAHRTNDAKALAYYELAVQADQDSVRVANGCEWLVFHYFRNGEVKRAEQLADRAAETYSAAGLRVRAELFELQTNYHAAFKLFRAIEERYNQSGGVVAFCVRYKAATGDTRYDAELQQRMKTLFPRGLEPVTLASFTGPVTEGIRLAQENELLLRAGLKRGDVIVALDGLRVYDQSQYQYVRGRTNAGPLKLIVWNGSRYVEVHASPPNRRFGVRLEDYFKRE